MVVEAWIEEGEVKVIEVLQFEMYCILKIEEMNLLMDCRSKTLETKKGIEFILIMEQLDWEGKA